MSEFETVPILISQEEIQEKILELGKQITKDYAGKELVLLGVLKGSFIFLSDLFREIDLNCVCEFMGLSSYGGKTTSSGVVKITQDLMHPIEGKHVIIVEDIVDTGLTLKYLINNLETRKPASVKVCTLLHKPDNTIEPIDISYLGFTIPKRFVVGYGMDYAERYRNLPFIGFLDQEAE
jgi:hypoxanthine phosphoribosyltransferase